MDLPPRIYRYCREHEYDNETNCGVRKFKYDYRPSDGYALLLKLNFRATKALAVLVKLPDTSASTVEAIFTGSIHFFLLYRPLTIRRNYLRLLKMAATVEAETSRSICSMEIQF